MGESNTVVNANKTYRHLQQYCCLKKKKTKKLWMYHETGIHTKYDKMKKKICIFFKKI